MRCLHINFKGNKPYIYTLLASMRKLIRYTVFTLMVAFSFISQAGNKVDSLLKRVKETSDTARICSLVRLAEEYIATGKMPEAENCLNEAGSINALIKDRNCEILITLKMALYRYRKSEFRMSYELCEEILLKTIEYKNKNYVAECKTYMGMSLGRLGDFKKALNFYQEALPLAEAANNVPLQMRLYSSIAGVYFDQLDYKMAVDYFRKTLEMAIKRNDKKVIGQTYNNIGSATQNLGNSKDAKEYYLKAAEINIESGNQNNLAYNYMNLASCELEEGDVEKAKTYNAKALQIFKDFKDTYSIVSCLCVDGDIYIKQKNYSKAIEIFKEATRLSEKTGSPLIMERTYYQMANAYELNGDLKNSINYYKKYLRTKDSIINDEIREEVTKKQLYFEFDKKRLSDSLEAQSKQLYLQQEVDNTNRRASLQRNISIISILSLLIVAVLAFMIYRGLQKNKLANKVIEEKNREILDSFFYAKKIQTALLPATEMFQKLLPDSFILFKPKDIVSGDFYWLHRINDDSFIIAVGDCTGHGVPGAMVSVVCTNALNRAAREFGITDPGKLLDKARELVIDNFVEHKGEVKDGMDISLCKIEVKKDSSSKYVNIEWAGANNPLWYTSGNCIIEVEADKQSIGFSENPKPFSSNEIELQKNEMVYLFSDGFADQFGGPKGKKFKYRQFQESLLKLKPLNAKEQGEQLNLIFESWRGTLEQVDDICVIGIRI